MAPGPMPGLRHMAPRGRATPHRLRDTCVSDFSRCVLPYAKMRGIMRVRELPAVGARAREQRGQHFSNRIALPVPCPCLLQGQQQQYGHQVGQGAAGGATWRSSTGSSPMYSQSHQMQGVQVRACVGEHAWESMRGLWIRGLWFRALGFRSKSLSFGV